VSSRMARHRKQRECYEAILCQNHSTGQYYVAGSTTATDNVTSSHSSKDAIVLRFLIVYGMSTVQQVLTDLSHLSPPTRQYDYIECMACSHSCINGNGQIRSTERETPTDVRVRVQQTRSYYLSQFLESGQSPNTLSSPQQPMIDESSPFLYTRYHVVPPMQHTLGVAAGIAVQDTIW
jgi:iron only hydrogenase large subunit-like protein